MMRRSMNYMDIERSQGCRSGNEANTSAELREIEIPPRVQHKQEDPLDDAMDVENFGSSKGSANSRNLVGGSGSSQGHQTANDMLKSEAEYQKHYQKFPTPKYEPETLSQFNSTGIQDRRLHQTKIHECKGKHNHRLELRQACKLCRKADNICNKEDCHPVCYLAYLKREQKKKEISQKKGQAPCACSKNGCTSNCNCNKNGRECSQLCNCDKKVCQRTQKVNTEKSPYELDPRYLLKNVEGSGDSSKSGGSQFDGGKPIFYQ